MNQNTLDSTGDLDALIGANLRRIRLARLIPQDVLAAYMASEGNRWTASTVSAIENGRRNVSLGELADVKRLLGVSLSELLSADQSEVDHRTWLRSMALLDESTEFDEPPIDHHLIPDDPGISLEDEESPKAQLLIAQERRMQETVWRSLFGGHPSHDERIRLHQAALFLFNQPLISERQERLNNLTGSSVVSDARSRTAAGHVTRSIIADFKKHLSEGGSI